MKSPKAFLLPISLLHWLSQKLWQTNFPVYHLQMVENTQIHLARQESRYSAQRRSNVAHQGFTLVELSVVVVIISMLLTLGISAFNSLLASTSYAETKKRQILIKDALTAYLGTNKRLPCPDVPNSTNGAADSSQVTGLEDRTGGVATGACNGQIGVVPYVALGLPREIALDGWGNFMSYSVATTAGAVCPGSGVDWTLTNCFGVGKTAPYILNEGFVAAPVLAASNIIAIVVSHGPNGFGSWAQQGTRTILPTGCEEAHNALAPTGGCTLTANAFYKGERPEVDDVVAPLSRDEAVNTLVKQGTIKSAGGQVSEDLAQLRNIWIDSLLTNCAAAAPAMTYDPWGNIYTSSAVVWPRRICTNFGGGTPVCASINLGELNTVITKMGGTTC